MDDTDNRSSAVRRISRLGGHITGSKAQAGTGASVSKENENVTSETSKLEYFLPMEPNETWTQETVDLYNQLKTEAENSDGEWSKGEWKTSEGETRHFLISVPEKGKLFEFAWFVNRKEQKIHGVVQCGPYTEGPKGFVQGGAVATLLDVACAYCTNVRRYLTASLTINYKRSVPLGSTVLILAKVDHTTGRKSYRFAEMKSADGETLYATATALFIDTVKQ